MEIDAASSVSSDSHIGNCHPGGTHLNYYTDNLYFTTNCKLDNYFVGDKLVKKIETTNRKIDYYKTENYCAVVNSANSNKSVVNKCDFNKRTTLVYNNSDCFEKKTEEVDNRRVQLDYYNNNNNNSNTSIINKKSVDGTIQLNNVDNYGKKPVSFSPDQVRKYKKL